jgi:hypothetical protein
MKWEALMSSCHISGGFFLGIFSVPEDGGDMFLRNMNLSLNYTQKALFYSYCSDIPIPSMALVFTVFPFFLFMYI